MLGELNPDHRLFVKEPNQITEWKMVYNYNFSSLMVTANSREWQEKENL